MVYRLHLHKHFAWYGLQGITVVSNKKIIIISIATVVNLLCALNFLT